MDFDAYLKLIVEGKQRSKIANINLSEIKGLHDETLLHYLAIENYIEEVSFLIEEGGECNTVNRIGSTPLIDCIILELKEMVHLLLENGAEVNFKDAHGDTALHKAFEYGVSKELKELLIKYGADPQIHNDLGETAYEAE